MSLETLRAALRDIPDFPKPGIIFKDISPILRSPHLFREAIDLLAAPYVLNPPATVVAIDARGFVFGAAVAYRLGTGMVMLRKPGKLPWKTHGVSYELEYGANQLEMHQDAIAPGDRVLLVDDVLATGGTARAAADLVAKAGGKLEGLAFLIELTFLHGRARLGGLPVTSLITVD